MQSDIFQDTSIDAIKKCNENIKPKKNNFDLHFFENSVFSILSVHEKLKNNIKAFNSIKKLDIFDLNNLENIIQALNDYELINPIVKASYIYYFSFDYWKNPKVYHKKESENFNDYRKRLLTDNKIKGLANCKTTFLICLNYINTGFACIDTNIQNYLRLDKITKNKLTYDLEVYNKCENVLNEKFDQAFPQYKKYDLFIKQWYVFNMIRSTFTLHSELDKI